MILIYNVWIRNAKETINDANDRAIRSSCLFFQKMVDGYGGVVLVTNDTDNQVGRKKRSNVILNSQL